MTLLLAGPLSTAVYMAGERPFIEIRDGLGGADSAFGVLQISRGGVEEAGALVVYSQGARFDLGSIS